MSQDANTCSIYQVILVAQTSDEHPDSSILKEVWSLPKLELRLCLCVLGGMLYTLLFRVHFAYVTYKTLTLVLVNAWLWGLVQRDEIVQWINEGGGEVVDDDILVDVDFTIECHGALTIPTSTLQTAYVSSHWVRSCLEVCISFEFHSIGLA